MSLPKNIVVYFSVLLVPVFMLQMSMNTIIYFQFKTNQAYVAKELCTNRFDAKSTCNGKCYLKSQLKKTDTNQSVFQQYVKYKIDLYFVPAGLIRACSGIALKKIYSGYVLFFLPDIPVDFFHPPA